MSSIVDWNVLKLTTIDCFQGCSAVRTGILDLEGETIDGDARALPDLEDLVLGESDGVPVTERCAVVQDVV